jgi:nitrite reductase/ring-hydroxylating ferredoxin subunit
MVPEPNQFRSLEWLDHSKLLINRDDGFYRMSNICRHRQAVMMQGAAWPIATSSARFTAGPTTPTAC